MARRSRTKGPTRSRRSQDRGRPRPPHPHRRQRDECRLYELFAARKTSTGWRAGSGAIWDLRPTRCGPMGWTSADAAGLPILPGLARYDEVAAGVIRHALRFTAPDDATAYIYPARHYASATTRSSLPPMGLRVRLKASRRHLATSVRRRGSSSRP